MQNTGKQSRSKKDKQSPIIGCFTFCFLSFVAGAALYEFGIFPGPFMRNAFSGAEAVYQKYIVYPGLGAYPPDIWTETERPETGVTIYDPAQASNGFTLYTSGHAQKAFLIAMDGRVVHEWSLTYREVWSDPPHVADPVDDEFIYWRMAHLYPNGDLLAIYIGEGDTPWGYGLVKIDKDSNLIWKYSETVHHDIDVTEDGTIYTLTHPISKNEVAGIDLIEIEPPFLNDMIVILSPEGEEIKKIPLMEAIRDSKYNTLFDRINTKNRRRDFLHSNSVDVVRKTIAGRDAILKQGQILVLLRKMWAVILVDPDSGIVTWALTGPWVAQHDPDILDNGHMLIFDNGGHFGPGGRSRVIEFDPFTQEIYWEYAGDDDHVFFSRLRGRQQRLPNGNTLITDSDIGRLVEVTPGKEIVWEYLSPHRAGENNELVAVITGGQRFTPESLTFLDHE